jgi:hypothetical protein
MEIDHIDGNPLNNKKSNLRIVTRQEQTMNLKAKRNSKTGIRGVSYSNSDKCYVVDFGIRKRRYYFSHYKDINEAVYARYMAEIILNPIYRRDNSELIDPYISQLTDIEKQQINQSVIEHINKRNKIYNLQEVS